jgi:hypothetical protein
MSDLPPEYAEIFQQLDQLNARGSVLANNAAMYRSIADRSIEGLSAISSKVKQLADMIKALKALLANLNNINSDLQSRLDQIDSEYELRIAELNSKLQSEIEQERAACEEQKRVLVEQLRGSSEAEKTAAIQQLEQQSQTTEARIKAEHDRAIQEAKAEQMRLGEGILRALRNVAKNQEIVIIGLEKALTGDRDPSELLQELSAIQSQVEGLLDGIKVELENLQSGALPQAPAGPLPSALSGAPQGSVQEIPPNYFAPEIDFNSPILPLTETSNNDEKFEYALKKLYTANKEGELSDDLGSRYNWSVLGPFNAWKALRNTETATAEGVLDKKRLLYKNVMSLYNEAFSPERINIQAGGRKTRRRRKVHFKTRRGGKKGGKRSKRHNKGKKGHTKRH